MPLARQISFRSTAHGAQKVAYNRSWDDLDIEATFEHRRESGLIKRKSGSRSRDYEGSEFGEPEHMNRRQRPDRRGGRGLSEPKEVFSYYPRSPAVQANP